MYTQLPSHPTPAPPHKGQEAQTQEAPGEKHISETSEVVGRDQHQQPLLTRPEVQAGWLGFQTLLPGAAALAHLEDPLGASSKTP